MGFEHLIYCPQCGKKVVRSRYCSLCGAKLPISPSEDPVAQERARRAQEILERAALTGEFPFPDNPLSLKNQANALVAYDTESAIELMKKFVENREIAGDYDKAVFACEWLGRYDTNMFLKARELRTKTKETTMIHLDLNQLIRQLTERGQTVTYHCCHCGAPLKVGSESTQPLRNCPSCGYDLQVIDLAKLISQHL